MQSQTPDNQRGASQAEEVADAAQHAAEETRDTVESWIPDVWMPDGWAPWAASLTTLAIALLAALAAHLLIFATLRRFARRKDTPLTVGFIQRLLRPMRLLMPLLAVQIVAPTLPLPEEARGLLQHAVSIGLIASVAWLLIAGSDGIEDIVLARHDISKTDNLKARRVHTQIRVITRMLGLVIIVIAIGAILMTFPRVRQLGTSLLASAGIAGVVVGLAARPMLSNIIAGLQIALAEPIRLDDVVIVAGEWGRIEEITSTYVVVRVWDERRLIVPLTHFLEQPFQNWTREGSELLGTAFLHLDYRAPVEEIREKLKAFCEASEKWDGRVAVTQVTDTSDKTMTVRLLVSAKSAGDLWDLRCEMREKMLAWIRAEYPECLPVVRTMVAEEGEGSGRGAAGAGGDGGGNEGGEGSL